MKRLLVVLGIVLLSTGCDGSAEGPTALGSATPAPSSSSPPATLSTVGDGIACQRFDIARAATSRLLSSLSTSSKDVDAASPASAAALARLQDELAAAAVSTWDELLHQDITRTSQAVGGVTLEQGRPSGLAVQAYELVAKRVTDRCSQRTTF